MPLVIRPSDSADIPAITAIYAHAVLHGTASFELAPPEAQEMVQRRATLVAGGFPYLVAEKGGRVVGYAYAGPYRPRPAYRHAVEDSIYVAPERQNQGIGKALLRALIERCEEQGFRQMVAVIGDSLSVGSISMHRVCGFADCGVVRNVGFKHGRWLDQVLMQRPLGEGASSAPA